MPSTNKKEDAPYCKPLLKWVGGKTQILPTVLEQFPDLKEGDAYIEPFLGGASVLLGALSCGKIGPGVHVFASDINAHLVNFYSQIRSSPDKLITKIRALLATMTVDELEKRYYEERTRFNENEDDPIMAAARFWFLNKTSFRGVYREGPRGYNVPFGHPKTLPNLDEAHFKSVSELVQRVTFTRESYETALEKVSAAGMCFAYLDPPYAPVDANSFVAYTAGGFDHLAFFEQCKNLTSPWLMSNANVELVRETFPASEFDVRSIQARRAIHSKDPSASASEVLISSPRAH